MNVSAKDIKGRESSQMRAGRGFAPFRLQVDLIALEFPRTRTEQTANKTRVNAVQALFNRTSAQC